MRPERMAPFTATVLLLQLVSCVTPLPESSPGPSHMLSGAFIQLDAELALFTQEEWRTELQAMKDIAMDTVVVQYAAYGESVYYPSGEGFGSEARDTIGAILTAADALSMRVYLGLSLDPAVRTGTLDPGREAELNQGVLGALHRLYGARPSLAGWYLPEELDDRSFQSADATMAVKTYLSRMSGFAHDTMGLPVMVSPYFGMKPNPAAYARWWDDVLAGAKIDIVALQDGVGTHRTTVAESAGVFAALAPVFSRHGVSFWANIEVFDQTHGWPVDNGSWSADTASMERVRAQIQRETPWVEKSIIFDFPHYMSPRLQRSLYQKYKQLLTGDSR